MLELILDKDFIDNFYINFDNSRGLHHDFRGFLEQVRDFKLISNYQDFEQLLEKIEENEYLEYLIFGKDGTQYPMLEYKENLKEEIKVDDFYKEGSPFKLFMIEEDYEELEQEYGFLFLQAQTIDPKWQSFNSEREDLALPIDSKSPLRFDSWAKISEFKHPFHNILIFDRFLFALFAKNNTQLASLDKNLYAFFLHFLSNKKMKKPLQITILTEEDKILLDDKNPQSCNAAKTRLKDFISENFPDLNTQISIIHYDKSKQDEKEHDRGIYTNYFFIKIGKGVNLFNVEGDISSRSDIEFKFIFRPMEYNLALSGLRSFQEYIDQSSHPRPNLLQQDL